MKKEAFIENLISGMTLEQKVGQCLVIGFVGTVVTPEILKRIRTYHPAGIRAGLTFRVKTAVHDPTAVGKDRYSERVVRPPRGTVKDFIPGIPIPHCTNEEYCAFLNRLKQEALDHGSGIPLHITLDMEGDLSNDYNRGGIHYFPSCMGLGLTGDRELVREVAWAVARQVTALGFNWIHSPVVDVNTNPMNPEIGTRGYSEDPVEVADLAIAALEGFREGGLVATAKHYPGRGESAVDAHDALPVIDVNRTDMESVHLYPYAKLIQAGLPAVMTAHTAYPSLDPSGESASLSRDIIEGVLREKLGFRGVVTSDAITMGGIIQKYEVPEACIRAIEAGSDLVLVRDESNLIDEVYQGMLDAAKNGRLSEQRLEDSIQRTLSVKYDYGLFENGNLKDVDRAGSGINDPKVAKIASDAAQRTVKVLRDGTGILPLTPEKKILLVEQINPLHAMTNSQDCHPSILWEHMFRYREDLEQVETALIHTENDKARVKAKLERAEVIVATSYYYRNQAFDDTFIRELNKSDKPLIVVSNTHYPTGLRDEFPTVIVSYGVGPESMRSIASVLFGQNQEA